MNSLSADTICCQVAESLLELIANGLDAQGAHHPVARDAQAVGSGRRR
jgi:hypothetical protein